MARHLVFRLAFSFETNRNLTKWTQLFSLVNDESNHFFLVVAVNLFGGFHRTINWPFVYGIFGMAACGKKSTLDSQTKLPIDEQMFAIAIDIFNLSLIACDEIHIHLYTENDFFGFCFVCRWFYQFFHLKLQSSLLALYVCTFFVSVSVSHNWFKCWNYQTMLFEYGSPTSN